MLNVNKFPIVNREVVEPFIFHHDAGHGWLAVPIDFCRWLGITSDVSPYSYCDSSFLYLEEDCDATLFDNAMKAKGLSYKTESLYQDPSPVRRKRRTR